MGVPDDGWYLGIGASHNGSACLLHGLEIAAAIQEERLSGLKRHRTWIGRDLACVRYVLDAAGIAPQDLTAIGVASGPALAQPANDPWNNPFLAPARGVATVHRVGHHLAHAVSAWETSGFDEADVLIVDGMGSRTDDVSPAERAVARHGPEGFESISMYRAARDGMRPLLKHLVPTAESWLGMRGGESRAQRGPGMPAFFSLGGMYSAAAEQIFGDPMDAGKVMGLAPFGEPVIPVEEFVTFDGDDIEYPSAVCRRFEFDALWPQHQQLYADLAASVQRALEAALEWLLRQLRRIDGPPARKLCYSGGVALNGIANSTVVRDAGYDDVFVIPAAEDSGLAVGAAYSAARATRQSHPRRSRRLRADSLGRRYADHEVRDAVESTPGMRAARHEDVVPATVDLLAAGHFVGWFEGGAELGPRALGHRSILADPRPDDAKDTLNATVKYRESFRPFAPAVTVEAAADWFDGLPADGSPFMLHVQPFQRGRDALVPAVRHIDSTGRVQTVARGDEPRFHALLCAWEDRSGIPILLNTSLNIAGMPIVETPSDAMLCLLTSGLSHCVIENWLVQAEPGVSLLDFELSWTGRTSFDDVTFSPELLAVLEHADGTEPLRDVLAEQLPGLRQRDALRIFGQLVRFGLLKLTPTREYSPR